jgi:hypothetical protein
MTLRQELQQIYDRHGQLTARLVVDQARDPEHALHSQFEWDDETAAEKYRLDQARELIRKVRVVYKPRDDAGFSKTRWWHSVATEDGRAYRTADEIAEDPFLLKLHLQNMEREWRALRERYDRFAEFAEMIRRDIEGGEAA